MSVSREKIRVVVAGALCLLLPTIIVVVYGTGLDRVPPHLAHDEVVIGLNARTVANHGLVADGNRFPALFGDSALGMPGGEVLTTYWTALNHQDVLAGRVRHPTRPRVHHGESVQSFVSLTARPAL
jgi:hypothetical protein